MSDVSVSGFLRIFRLGDCGWGDFLSSAKTLVVAARKFFIVKDNALIWPVSRTHRLCSRLLLLCRSKRSC